MPASPRPVVHVVNLFPAAVGVVILVLAVSFFGQASTPLLAVILAAILAAALNPVTRFLTRWLPRGLAAGMTVLGALVVTLGLGAIAVPPIAAQFADLIAAMPTSLTEVERRVEGLVAGHPQLEQLIQEDVLATGAEQAAGWAAGFVGGVIGVAGTVTAALFLALVTVIMVLFMLGSPRPLLHGLIEAVPERHREPTARTVAEVLERLGAWGRATIAMMLIVGGVMGGGLFLMGFENWLVFGALAALGELVPNIGPILAVVPPIVSALADDPMKAVWVAVFAIVVQQLESYVLAPFLLGSAGKLHPLAVTVGVLLFGSVFGLIGAFMTVPFLIILMAVYRNFVLARRATVPQELVDALIAGDDGVLDPPAERPSDARLGRATAADSDRDNE